MTNEFQLQSAIVARYRNFYESCYPDCKLIANPFSSMKLPAKYVKIAKLQGFENGQPDLIFIQKVGKYNGLVLELKIGNVYKKTKPKELLKSKHLENQNNFLNSFKELGFYTTFSVGFDESVNILDRYFTNML